MTAAQVFSHLDIELIKSGQRQRGWKWFSPRFVLAQYQGQPEKGPAARETSEKVNLFEPFLNPIAQKFTISIRRTHKIHFHRLVDFLSTVRLVQAVFCGRLNLCSFSLSWRSSLTILRASSNNTKLSQKKKLFLQLLMLFSLSKSNFPIASNQRAMTQND